MIRGHEVDEGTYEWSQSTNTLPEKRDRFFSPPSLSLWIAPKEDNDYIDSKIVMIKN